VEFDFGVGRPGHGDRRRQEISAAEVAELRRVAAGSAFGVASGPPATGPVRRFVFAAPPPPVDAQRAPTRELPARRRPAARPRALTSQPTLVGVSGATTAEMAAALPTLRSAAHDAFVEPLARALEWLARWLRR
jgi:hypothetical protein